MKRTTLLVFVFLSMAIGLFAQKPSLNKAYNLFYDKDFVKAKEMIDLCTQDLKMETKAQTWLYKGNIYFYLANQEYGEKQNNDSYVVKFPDSPIESFDAFQKAKEIDKNAESYEMLSPDDGISKLYALLLIRGVDQLIANDFETAKSTLQKSIYSYELKTPEHPLEGEIYYYYAYTLEMLGQQDEAMKNYEKAINDGSSNVNVYVRLIEQYKKDDNKTKIEELIRVGKQKNPTNPNILIAEVDYFWDVDRTKGEQLLNALPASAYANADALVNIANLYIRNNDFKKAEELLNKANRLNPDNFIIVYNLGYCYLKLYEQTFKEANDLAIQGNKDQAQLLTTQSENYLTQAESNFEKALESDPKDLNILEQLKEIYARKKSPKYDEMMERINQIKK